MKIALQRLASRKVLIPTLKNRLIKKHIVRALSNYLNECKSIDFGLDNDKLTDSVREYIMICFSNKEDFNELQRAIRSITPHAFGDHSGCGDWCRFEKL